MSEDVARQARLLARAARKGALATLGAGKACGEGWPHVSLVSIGWTQEAEPVFLLSSLAEHTRNLLADERVSLLIEGAQGYANPQTAPRVTLVGRVSQSDGDGPRFLARHPQAARYAGFGDFQFYRMHVERAHLVGGFGRAHWLKGEDFLSKSLKEEETAFLEAVDAHALARALGRKGDGWQAVTADGDGVDLRCGNRFARADFSAPHRELNGWRKALAAIA